MRFLFSPPDETAVGLLTLPWAAPLQSWTDSRLVEVRQRGISRHVVRFVAEGGCLYALKQIRIEVAAAVDNHPALLAVEHPLPARRRSPRGVPRGCRDQRAS